MVHPVSKVKITHTELRKIVDGGLRTFHETKHLPDDPKEAQAYLIISGLALFLISQGIEPQFELKKVKEDPDDPTPLDDL